MSDDVAWMAFVSTDNVIIAKVRLTRLAIHPGAQHNPLTRVFQSTDPGVHRNPLTRALNTILT